MTREAVGCLDGIRVVEVANWVFVPVAGAVLAEWGADVLKIEDPERGDPLRGLVTGGQIGLPKLDAEPTINVLVEHSNRGKRSVAIDISSEDGLRLLLDLVATADVFLTNHLPKVRRKLRIDYDDIRAVNPAIVYVRGTALGPRGPEADHGGFEASAGWARGGCAEGVEREDGARPPFMPISVHGDSLGGLMIAGSVSAALLRRDRTGMGALIDCSLLSMGVWTSSVALAQADVRGVDTFRLPPHEAPYNPLQNIYVTSDGRGVCLAYVESDRWWGPLMKAVGRPELIDDVRFADAAARAVDNRACVALLEALFASRSLAEWKVVLDEVAGPWAVVQDHAEVLRDPQVEANGFLRTIEFGDGVSGRLAAAPLQFDEATPPLRRAPHHGEHTDEALLQLGLDMDEILDLKVRGAVF